MAIRDINRVTKDTMESGFGEKTIDDGASVSKFRVLETKLVDITVVTK